MELPTYRNIPYPCRLSIITKQALSPGQYMLWLIGL